MATLTSATTPVRVKIKRIESRSRKARQNDNSSPATAVKGGGIKKGRIKKGT